MLIFFPGCFCLISLILATVAVVFVEQDEAGITEAKRKEEEFLQILEVLKRRKEEEAVRGSFLSSLCFYI